MEVTGPVQIFQNSVSKGNRYTKYLGDGVSKGFQSVVKSKPHGKHIDIVKLECIGHFQKGIGSKLRKCLRMS